MTFKEWMQAVDRYVWSKAGCSVHDLPDCLFRDWYDRNVKPKAAAGRAIKNSRQ